MKRIVSGIAVLALALGGLATFGVAVAGAAPTMTATPSTGLTQGEAVAVTGSGFTPSASLALVECTATATTTADCGVSQNFYLLVTADSSGDFSATYHVQTGAIGTNGGTCGTSAADANCLLVVGTTAGVLQAQISITFASGTTTTTAPVTTTTAPVTTTTTTTKPPTPAPHATKVTGVAIPGKTVTMTIIGSHFVGKPRITGHAGTTATVTKATSSRLTVKVKEAANAKKGTFNFVLHFANGKTATVKYRVS